MPDAATMRTDLKSSSKWIWRCPFRLIGSLPHPNEANWNLIKLRVDFEWLRRCPFPTSRCLQVRLRERSVDIGDLELEIMLHRNHSGALDWVSASSEELKALIDPYLDRANKAEVSFPYSRFTLVEVPCTLRGYSGEWPLGSVMSSPGVGMFREWSLVKAPLEKFIEQQEQYMAAWGGTAGSLTLTYLQAYLQNDEFGASLGSELWRNFTSFQTQAYGPGAITLDIVVRQLARSLFMGGSDVYGWASRSHFSALEIHRERLMERLTTRTMRLVRAPVDDVMAYLSDTMFDGRMSGWDALSRPVTEVHQNLDVQRSWEVLGMKARVLALMLYDVLGEEDTGRFLAELLDRYRGKTYTLEDVSSIAADLELPVLQSLENWLLGTKLAGLTVEKISVHERVDDEGKTEFRTLVSVRNNEAAPGVFSARLMRQWEHLDTRATYAFSVNESAYVPPESSVQVTFTSEVKPESVSIQPYLSLNRTMWYVQIPSVVERSVGTEQSETVTGRYVSSRADDSQDIVIDDLDDAFTVANVDVPYRGFRLIRMVRPDLVKTPDLDGGIPRYDMLVANPKVWSRGQTHGAYGKYRRTTAVGVEASEVAWASFEADLPESDNWTLGYHMPLDPSEIQWFQEVYGRSFGEVTARSRPWGKQGKYEIHIVQENFEQVVNFDASLAIIGWNKLGTFNLASGPTSVLVSNRTDGSYVYADAVRWRRADSDDSN